MAQATPLALVSFQEYLDFEETTLEKHELYRGRIIPRGGVAYAMAGGSSNHGNVIDSLTAICNDALRDRKPCRFVGQSRRLRSKPLDQVTILMVTFPVLLMSPILVKARMTNRP